MNIANKENYRNKNSSIIDLFINSFYNTKYLIYNTDILTLLVHFYI